MKFFWLFPFIFFCIGYILIANLTNVAVLETPTLLGLSTLDAVSILSNNNLNLKIISQKEDNDLPDGTITSQSPQPNSKIRPGQSIFLITTKKSEPVIMPNLFGKTENEIKKSLAYQKIKIKTYYLNSELPAGMCVAQYPNEGELIKDKKNTTVIIYLSQGSNNLAILPNLKGFKVSEIQEFLSKNNVKAQIYHTYTVDPSHICNNCVIRDQKPLSGSLIDTKKPLIVYLTVN